MGTIVGRIAKVLGGRDADDEVDVPPFKSKLNMVDDGVADPAISWPGKRSQEEEEKVLITAAGGGPPGAPNGAGFGGLIGDGRIPVWFPGPPNGCCCCCSV